MGASWKRRRPRSLVRWIVVGGLFLAALAYYKPARTYVETRGTVAEREAQVERLRRQHHRLERLVAASTTEAELSREARRLGFVKPGERLFIVKGIDRWRTQHASLAPGG
jgi:hypothetical protein